MCTGHDYSSLGKPQVDRDDQQAKDALVSALVNDANALLAALSGDERAAGAVALLAPVAWQDVEPAEGSDGTDGRRRIARKVAEDRVISTVDPEARHTRKSSEVRWDGFRAHVAACPETGINTGARLTRAAGEDNSDAAVAARFTLDDFTIDETAGTVTCLAGVSRPISERRHVTFGAACRGCPLHHQQARPCPDPAQP